MVSKMKLQHTLSSAKIGRLNFVAEYIFYIKKLIIEIIASR